MRLPPPDIFVTRAAQLRQLLGAHQLDGLLVTSLPNVAYLTGFFASSAALIATSDAMFLISDGRYAEALEERARGWTRIHPVLLAPGQSYDQAVVDTLDPLRGLQIGFEASHLTVRRHRFLLDSLVARGWDAQPTETDGLVESLRVKKDDWEIRLFREAGGRLSTVAKCILSRALGGRTECDVAADIDTELRRSGFDRPSFDTIVAAGPNAALPHARAGRRRIEDGDLVVLDFGGVLDGYCTDMSRTVTAGSASARERRLIEQVAEGQEAAFNAVRSGVAPEAVDGAARDSLAHHGLNDAFTHGTGHGLGLEVHEAPRITRARASQAEPPLMAGMVMTLEPGVYFPGWGGVRIEDDVLVTEQGAEWLTR
jgi:Xaa-Pro aminopeptidase